MRMKSLLLALAVILPLSAQAQASPDSVKHRNDCRLAVQVLTTGNPAVKADWAIRQMRTCPAGAAELARAFRAARSGRDTASLNRLTAPADWLRDGSMFSAALEVLRDRNASPEARVYAARVAMWAYVPGEEIRYEHLVDADGDGDWTCSGLGPSLHGEVVRGTPLPAGWIESGTALGRALSVDDSEPVRVRQAARCLALVIPFPYVRNMP